MSHFECAVLDCCEHRHRTNRVADLVCQECQNRDLTSDAVPESRKRAVWDVLEIQPTDTKCERSTPCLVKQYGLISPSTDQAPTPVEGLVISRHMVGSPLVINIQVFENSSMFIFFPRVSHTTPAQVAIHNAAEKGDLRSLQVSAQI